MTDALIDVKPQFIHMPNTAEMQATSENNFDRFHLPRFGVGVDGMMVKFTEAPRRLPANKHKQLFWCRKQSYAINVQVVSTDNLICDVDCKWPGSTNDSRIWNRSEAKAYFEGQREYYVAGDTGYPLNEVLIKPYSTEDAGGDRKKPLFNKRLSGL